MNKKLQVFVSSTYTDLIEERQAAVEAILDAGHIPAGMELFKSGKSQMQTIKKWIDESDVYMLILGGRYGSIEEESGLSYTELEYRYALSKNIPVFSIILTDNFLFTKAATKGKDCIFEKKYTRKYDSFKKLVMSQIVKQVNDIPSIASSIHANLNEFISDADYNLTGWMKNPSSMEYYNMEQSFSSLSKRYNDLQNKYDSLVEEFNTLNFTHKALIQKYKELEQFSNKDEEVLKMLDEMLTIVKKNPPELYKSIWEEKHKNSST